VSGTLFGTLFGTRLALAKFTTSEVSGTLFAAKFTTSEVSTSEVSGTLFGQGTLFAPCLHSVWHPVWVSVLFAQERQREPQHQSQYILSSTGQWNRVMAVCVMLNTVPVYVCKGPLFTTDRTLILQARSCFTACPVEEGLPGD
jgi:hypothetical protein